jgi:hypothetical protein
MQARAAIKYVMQSIWVGARHAKLVLRLAEASPLAARPK